MGCPASGCVGYELANDLDFDTDSSSTVNSGDDYWNSGHGWVPIGAGAGPFSAIFDGNGRVISNLYIDSDTKTRAADGQPGAGSIGLFEKISAGAEVRNAGLANVEVYKLYSCYVACGDGHMGALAGVNHRKISVSWATGMVSNAAGYAAQFRGHNGASQFAVRTGGLVGLTSSSSAITNSYTIARVSALTDWPAHVGAKAGGLVGQNSGSITDSYAAGAVSGGGDGTLGPAGRDGLAAGHFHSAPGINLYRGLSNFRHVAENLNGYWVGTGFMSDGNHYAGESAKFEAIEDFGFSRTWGV